MRKWFLMVAAILFATLSCDSNNGNDNPEGPETKPDNVSVSVKEKSLGCNGGSVKVIVRSSKDWTLAVTGASELITPSQLSGKNEDKVTFEVAPNSKDKDLEAVCTFTVGEKEATLKIYIERYHIINTVVNMNDNWAWPELGYFAQVENMQAFTMEALIYGNDFPEKADEDNISTVMGIEDHFLIHMGGDTYSPNKLMVTCGVEKDDNITRTHITSSASTSPLNLSTQKWYHIAATFDKGAIKLYLDGKLEAEGTIAATTRNFMVPHSNETNGQPRCFWVGYSHNEKRGLNGMFSEVRIWNKALTSAEINAKDHFYTVPVDSDGLILYWKCNDRGSGVTIKDHATNKINMTTQNHPMWVSVYLP